ncbi:hypothetical protein FQR65_LT02754 [Abscondita terminalis]|nr:hypothetical protein FQR65_LT02754 [Abscondita terminalis]
MSLKESEVITNILCEFLEVVIHNILYIRKLYPECIFVKRKKYGVVVYRSIHPQLNEYITECLKAVRFHAKEKLLRRLLICIVGPEIIYERFVLEVLSLQNNFEKDVLYMKLEQSLRDFCLKLQTTSSYLDPLPNSASFRIMLHTTNYSNLLYNNNPTYEGFPMICVQEYEYKISSPDIVPMHTVDTDSLVLQIYVEKNSA